MTREITHMKAFTAALESMGKDRFVIGKISPTPVLVDQYFNDSTGVGDEGETDARGPWNEGGDWEIVDSPALEEGVENLNDDGELNKQAAGEARKSGIRKGAAGSKVGMRSAPSVAHVAEADICRLPHPLSKDLCPDASLPHRWPIACVPCKGGRRCRVHYLILLWTRPSQSAAKILRHLLCWVRVLYMLWCLAFHRTIWLLPPGETDNGGGKDLKAPWVGLVRCHQ